MYSYKLDWDTVDKVQRANKNLSEYVHLLANEPSIGLYHVQEHVRKTVPKLVDIKKNVKAKRQTITEVSYDIDYSVLTAKSLQSVDTFQSVLEMLQRSTQKIENLHPSTTSRAPVAPASNANTTTFVKKEFTVTTPPPPPVETENTSSDTSDNNTGNDSQTSLEVKQPPLGNDFSFKPKKF